MEAEPDPGRMLDYYAEVATGRAQRIAPLQAVIRHAAGADTDVAALWNETEAQRRRGAGIVVARLRRKAGPHSPLPDERAADVVWILNDAALYRSLVTDRAGPSPSTPPGWRTRCARSCCGKASPRYRRPPCHWPSGHHQWRRRGAGAADRR
jgi:hypothetical protein